MLLHEVEQGTPEWHAARAGVITASMFSTVRAKLKSGPNKGDYSAAAKGYAFRLACERIAGSPLVDDQFETYAMRRGRELEETCRRLHEAAIGEIVDLAGLVTTEDNRFGASADSLIGQHGGAEYKCFYAPDKVRPILVDNDWGDIADQVQGCLWITGRKWWDQCLYFPALDSIGRGFTRRRVERDEAYIESLEQDLVQFDALVESYKTEVMKGAGYE